MKKFLTLIFSVTALTFCGCAGKSTQAQASSSEPSGDVSAYLQGAYVSVADSEAKLTAAGFEVLSKFKSVKEGKTIVFTCPTLKKEAAKPNRANIAVMKLFVDDQEKTISFSNPVYFGKAYMQDDYNHATFSAVKAKLEGAFPGLKNSEDKMEFDDLAGFHFTLGMPYYEDTKVLGEGSNEELLAKLKNYKKGKGLAYELKISDDTTLVGYSVGRGTQRFVKKIGRANAGLLPWPIVVSGGKATMLQAEYYIAMNYPLLGMMQFATIASVPGDVIKDLKKPFK
ncbi:hypothetical protein HUE87_12275 [Candidatus Sulfurimonas marisnigri]|uniref:DUF302 domain-containing protein n=1 Tax=Candidatus Sulfurimonas marisnigri TaxID=2740405 RepID=A0A7S7M0F7_9BACT|nr:hypothetical protein [Candidatus Sulfurimonas marisnigri]QOY54620.1 hypothetical protein HUE87_12275 [Candidatus Sulfurimonas marisnigri]